MARRFYAVGVGTSRPEKSKVKLTRAELAALADDMTQLATQALQLVADYRAYVGHSGDAEAAPLHERADEMISEWFK